MERRRLLSISEAAAQLGVSVGTLRNWADKGLVEMVKLPSGYRRFDPDAIDRLQEDMRSTTKKLAA